MAQEPKKMLVLGLRSWTAFVCVVGVCAVAEADEFQGFQPQVLNHSGIYGLRHLEPALTGVGVKIGVICRSISYIDGEPQYDYVPNIGHTCFGGKNIAFMDAGEHPPGISPHSTAICSILFGQDSDAFAPALGRFSFEGIVPEAKAEVYEFWHFVTDYVFPGLVPDADVITASVGSQFEDWWTRGIDSLVDQYGLIVVAGIGNGLNAGDPLLYPGAAANVIGVGVVDSVNSKDLATRLSQLALAYPQHSSFGPTADGRCKPDLVAPGNCLAADDNEPNGYEPTGNWSSFSTPIVAGAIGLLVQKARLDPTLSSVVSPEGGNCVVKAILMNSAVKLPYWHKGRLETDDDHEAPLDYIQGAGMLNAGGAYEHLTGGQNKPGAVASTGWDLNGLDQDQDGHASYRITAPGPAGKRFSATLVWNKHYNDVYPFEPLRQKDADLRLELWAVDPNDANNDYLLDYSDSNVDNVEHIYCRLDANYIDYEIVVSAGDANDPNQVDSSARYGLAWNVSDAADSNSILWYDLTADGIVNDADFDVFFHNWGASDRPTGEYLLGDVNADGKINEDDLLDHMLKHVNEVADWRTE